MAINIPLPGVFRDQILTDISNGYYEQGLSVPTSPGSDFYIEATALDNQLNQLANMIGFLAEQANETTATDEALDVLLEAVGLPELLPSGAAGRLVVTVTGGGLASFPDGTEFSLPNGKLGQVDGAQSSISNGGTVAVVMIDTGSDTNADPGTQAKWTAPPTNVQTVAVVDVDGLTGGTDEEEDEHKRERILNARQNTPASANWSHLVQIAESATNTNQKAYVFPALGGPGSVKVVVQKAIVPGSNYSHEISDI